VTAARSVTPAPAIGAGLTDPRLLAWRALLADASATALRTYQRAWSEAELDEPGRVVAAIGALDTHPGHLSGWRLVLPEDGTFATVVAAAGLQPGEEAVLAAAWWAGVDPHLAVAFGCLHDDPSRRYASLGLLALSLAPFGIPVPLAIAADHRLVGSGLLDLVADAATPLRLPPSTAALLAGPRADPPPESSLPARLAGPVDRAVALIRLDARVLVRSPLPVDLPLVLDAVAARLGLPVAPEPKSTALARTLLQAGIELPAVALAVGVTLPAGAVLAVAGPQTAANPGWHVLDVVPPTLEEARRYWRKALRGRAIRATGSEIVELAGRLPLSESSIEVILDTAATAARAEGRVATVRDVGATLRAHPRHDLAGFARRLPPAVRLDELVLSDYTRSGLSELLAHARYSTAAGAELGLTGVRGQAVIALFHGASGTGKTAAAEAVAAELDRDLWVVDLARVVSKWLGETQRNLDAVLTEAAQAGAVLLFDEADGLFGKRGEVADARDRYANLEIDHLLQRIELHSGVVVLTSNRPAALDEAFARRIRISVRFDLPDHAQREQLWRRLLPSARLADGVDTDRPAREELSGAAIRSAAHAACVLAIDQGGGVTEAHLAAAVGRELEKQKRPPTARGAQR